MSYATLESVKSTLSNKKQEYKALIKKSTKYVSSIAENIQTGDVATDDSFEQRQLSEEGNDYEDDDSASQLETKQPLIISLEEAVEEEVKLHQLRESRNKLLQRDEKLVGIYSSDLRAEPSSKKHDAMRLYTPKILLSKSSRNVQRNLKINEANKSCENQMDSTLDSSKAGKLKSRMINSSIGARNSSMNEMLFSSQSDIAEKSTINILVTDSDDEKDISPYISTRISSKSKNISFSASVPTHFHLNGNLQSSPSQSSDFRPHSQEVMSTRLNSPIDHSRPFTNSNSIQKMQEINHLRLPSLNLHMVIDPTQSQSMLRSCNSSADLGSPSSKESPRNAVIPSPLRVYKTNKPGVPSPLFPSILERPLTSFPLSSPITTSKTTAKPLLVSKTTFDSSMFDFHDVLSNSQELKGRSALSTAPIQTSYNKRK